MKISAYYVVKDYSLKLFFLIVKEIECCFYICLFSLSFCYMYLVYIHFSIHVLKAFFTFPVIFLYQHTNSLMYCFTLFHIWW